MLNQTQHGILQTMYNDVATAKAIMATGERKQELAKAVETYLKARGYGRSAREWVYLQTKDEVLVALVD